jgi:hypothetical protein
LITAKFFLKPHQNPAYNSPHRKFFLALRKLVCELRSGRKERSNCFEGKERTQRETEGTEKQVQQE